MQVDIGEVVTEQYDGIALRLDVQYAFDIAQDERGGLSLIDFRVGAAEADLAMLDGEMS